MDFSDIFSILFANKNNNQKQQYSCDLKTQNQQNIYPHCPSFDTQERTNNNNNFSNNSSDDLLTTLMPLLLSGKNISSQEILKKIGGNNALISTVLSKMENKDSSKKHTSKIDVSNLVKVEQE